MGNSDSKAQFHGLVQLLLDHELTKSGDAGAGADTGRGKTDQIMRDLWTLPESAEVSGLPLRLDVIRRDGSWKGGVKGSSD